MKIAIFALAVLGIGILAILVVASRQPNDFHVERSGKVSAKSSVVFAKLNDFHEWPAWSPWAKLDPSMRTSFDGSPSGVGARYAWVGNNKVGEGSMNILESVPDSRLLIQLEFIRPFKASNRTTFTLFPEGEETVVKWSMDGHNALLSKVMGLFVNMDKLIGADFERGLSNLNEVVASAPSKS